MVVFILVVVLVIVLAMLIFAIANATPVTVNLVFSKLPTQLSLAIIVPFLAGIVVGLLAMVPGSIKSGLTIASQKRRIGTLEKASPEKQMPAPGEPPTEN